MYYSILNMLTASELMDLDRQRPAVLLYCDLCTLSHVGLHSSLATISAKEKISRLCPY
jgi:hypothetical protein